ncbi:amidohydrolase family protein [Jidongwangia harbinensis]|uniref:amidohydrolase family protein n=1 Tax=Jidongwangia harbinensis TaxID=2878561 RepID=UPI001CD94309|nr:amidohydrolase family protein [Jidongwangia harbinensis]MCA2219072.1 amidohydrolase family protein [Jidongwangia harbinensis]
MHGRLGNLASRLIGGVRTFVAKYLMEADMDKDSGSGEAAGPHLRRRSLLGAAAGIAAAGGVGVAGGPARAEAAARPEPSFAPGRSVVFRNATVVTGDPRLGVRYESDVLVIGGTVRAIGRNLSVPGDAAVIDGRGAIVMPGMIDTHRHMWQTVIRGLGAEWTIANYFGWIYERWASFWRPEDLYASSLLSMAESINAGVTTTVDWSQDLRSYDYAEAAAEALFDSGARARLAYGYSFIPPQDWVLKGDVARLQRERFSSNDQLVTLQLAWDGTGTERAFPERPAWEFARAHHLPVTMHSGVRNWMADEQILNLRDNGFLLPTNTYVHCGTMSESNYQLIADSGGTVSIAAESELNAGQGYPPTGRIRAHGIPVSLSSDTQVWWSADMFAAMRATLNADRGIDHYRAHGQGKTVVNNNLRTQDVLHFATQGGADTLGESARLGSITPGKFADLVMVRADTPSMVPLINPVHQLVFHAQRGEVDTVMVHGRVLKHDGRLLGGLFPRARRLAEASMNHLRDRIGEQQWSQSQDPPPFEMG